MSSAFHPLPILPDSGSSAARLSLCIVTGELAGPDVNGGIGTANLGLAQALAQAGHRVEFLYTRVQNSAPHPSKNEFEAFAHTLARQRITLRHIEHDGRWDDWLAKSHAVMDHIMEGDFDAVFFNDTHGNGFASLVARNTGAPAFQSTRMIVVAHSATQWIMDLNRQAISGIADIELIEMERRSVELADVLISPSRYLLETYRSYGWTLPERTHVHPNILPLSAIPPRRADALNGPPDELVFFGRLETRKGLWLFCNALDRLKASLAGRRVTFMGRSTLAEGGPTAITLLDRAASWPFDVRLLTDYDSSQALAYLARRQCLAVMPSLADNSPCAIAECLAAGIPFLSTTGSGIEELVDPENHAACLVAPEVGALAGRLDEILQQGQAPARPAETGDAAAGLLAWLARLCSEEAPLTKGRPKPPGPCLLLALQEEAGRGSTAWVDAALEKLPRKSRALVIDETWLARPDELAAAVARAARGAESLLIATQRLVLTEEALRRGIGGFAARPALKAISGIIKYPAGEEATLPFGPSPALSPLRRGSNSGFALLRAPLAAEIDDCSPIDSENGRILPAQTWLHRLFAHLAAQGHRCELLPDWRIDALPASSPAFEGFDAVLTGATDPGASPILRHMAVTRTHGQERRRAAMSRFAAQPRLEPLARALAEPGGDRLVPTLMARMARAAGHPETALDILKSALTDGAADDADAIEPALRRVAHSISLLDLAVEERCQKRNLDHPWSYKVIPGSREIELHPNPLSEGRATLQFTDVDLSRTGRFEALLQLPQRSANPVICRIEIRCRDLSMRLVEEVTLQPGGTDTLGFDLPPDLRRLCQIDLAVYMAFDPDQTRDSWVRWREPVLLADAPRPSPAPAWAEVAAR